VAGEIKASGTSGHLVRDVRLGGSRCHRSRGRERTQACICRSEPLSPSKLVEYTTAVDFGLRPPGL
jgi:hypothetical protein